MKRARDNDDENEDDDDERRCHHFRRGAYLLSLPTRQRSYQWFQSRSHITKRCVRQLRLCNQAPVPSSLVHRFEESDVSSSPPGSAKS